MNITNAIDSSIAEDRTVWLDWSANADLDLTVECEDGAEYDSRDGLVREFWGERDGLAWRVCLVRPVAEEG